MSLFEILSKRAGINILKMLYDNEILEKKSYTLKLSEIKQKLNLSKKPSETLLLLQQAKLIELETTSDSSDMVLSITKKGRNFMENFKALKASFEATGVEKPIADYKIEYALTDLEKRILVLCYKLQKEKGGVVLLNYLTQEVYPLNADSKVGTVSRYVAKLEKLNLMQKIKQNNKLHVEVTNSGERVVKQQLMEMMV